MSRDRASRVDEARHLLVNEAAAASTSVESETMYSPNVPRIMVYQLIDGICFSVWQATVLQVFLYNIGGNALVGWLSGVSGIAQVVAAGIGSWAADTANRAVLVRCGAFSGAVASAVSILATYYEAAPLFWMSSVNWGFYAGMSNPAVEALFGDSVATGNRAKIYTYKWMLQIISFVFGYALNLILFVRLGDEWTMPEIKTIMYCGLSLHYVAFCVLLLAHDRLVLPPASPTSPPSPPASPSAVASPSSVRTNTSASSAAAVTPKSAADVTAAEKYASAFPDEAEENEAGLRAMQWSRIPYFITAGDILLAIGSGMTLRYLPLFFVNDYKIDPTVLMGVLMCISLTTTAAAAGIRVVGERFLGRVATILLVRFTGVSGLLYLAVATGPAANLAPMCAVWVVRNSLMNSTLGISRSVIMDFVPKDQRARWSAMESFSNFTWAGSAVIGGYVADKHGYRGTFFVTVALHYCACVAIIPALISSHKVERWIMADAAAKRAAAKAPVPLHSRGGNKEDSAAFVAEAQRYAAVSSSLSNRSLGGGGD